MTTERALALPDESQFRADIQAINRFQNIVHQNLVEGQDYGVIPGTTKPTLLKPGAEKIAKLLGLSDQYEIVDRQEDWVKPFFRYLIKCKLIHVGSQSLISEGMGECNSMESKYRWRWLSERDLPSGIDKTKLITQKRSAKNGGHWSVFRFENDDIYSQVNTILKMAKKRALVDAALSAGRLSNVFTQDIEDMGVIEAEVIREDKKVDKTEHWCAEHNTAFFKSGRMKGYAHPIEGELDKDGKQMWCNESEPQSDNTGSKSTPPAEQKGSETPKTEPTESTAEYNANVLPNGLNLEDIRQQIDDLQWSDVGKWLSSHFKIPVAKRVSEMLEKLTREQAEQFVEALAERKRLQ